MHYKLLNKDINVYKQDEDFEVQLTWESERIIENTCVRFVFWSIDGHSVASSLALNFGKTEIGTNVRVFKMPLAQLVEGVYDVTLVLFEKNEFGASTEIDVVKPAFSFEIVENKDLVWSPSQWGSVRLPDMQVLPVEQGK
jgi:hypothetical protein